MVLIKQLDLGGNKTAASSAKLRFIPPKKPTTAPPAKTITPPAVKPPTGGGGGGGGGNLRLGTSALTTTTSTDTGGTEATGPSEMDIINSEFDELFGFLSGQEDQARTDATSSTNLLKNEYDQGQQILGERETFNQNELGNRRTEVGLDNQQAMVRIKQNLSELQDRGTAYLSSVGGFGSNLGQAVAEKLGRVAQGQVGGLAADTNKALNAITMEGQKVTQFFNEKRTTLQQSYLRGVQDIEMQLNQRLAQIGQAKAESRANKAQMTLDAWRTYTNSLTDLKQSIFSTQQQLMTWALSKTEDLKQAQAFALSATPRVNPASFGLVRPDQPMTSGLGTMPTFGATSGIRVNLNASDAGEEEDPYNSLQTFAQ